MSQDISSHNPIREIELLIRSVEQNWQEESDARIASLEERLRKLEERGYSAGPSFFGKSQIHAY